ncbi:MAG: hypothetical protein OK422_01915 [Thaumarchaeota archaeon]|nr:hypothetical protein [Nitrososphaerota archaeon]
MAESDLHRRMKSLVTEDLEKEGYWMVEEPLFPPGEEVSWFGYRPDLFGVRAAPGSKDYVVVECETHPNMKRLLAKRFSTLSIQSELSHHCGVKKILAIPSGTLQCLDMGVRKEWEVWVIGIRNLMKIPMLY